MSSTFFGLSVATSGLSAQRRALDVIGYNIANANDPTYKRQRIVMVENRILAQSQEASALGVSPFGSGVSGGDIDRVRDTLVENRVRQATQASAEWAYRAQTMSQIQSTLGEPSDNGLQASLDKFWDSWDKVATSPQELPVRSALLEDASALCQQFQYINQQMQNTLDDLNMAVKDGVDRVNQIVQEIGQLNEEIGSMQTGQVPINDLQNRRDALVLDLSKLVGITQHGDGKEDFVISIGGRVIVQGAKVNHLDSDTIVGGNRIIQWVDDGQVLANPGGQLKAMTDMRDSIIPSYIGQLDDIASTLVARINTLNRQGKALDGTAGVDFFKPGTASGNITLDAGIVDHPVLIAASADGAVGNGDNAHLISGTKDTIIADGLTINGMYRALVGDIGGTTAIADRQTTAQKLSLDQFTTMEQSVSGVSLDEEMTNMIKFQQAYNASARVITVMNEMLDTLMGTVGR